MNVFGRKIISLTIALAMVIAMMPSVGVHANNESNAAYAAFGALEAECQNMSAMQAIPKPTLEEQLGMTGWKLSPDIYAASYIRCKIDDSFMYAVRGEYTPIAEVTYFDSGYGGFCLYYDSRDGYKDEFVQLENSGQWKTKVFYLYDAYFANGLYTDDFWIATNVEELMGKSSSSVIISSVKVTKSEKAAPFDISVSTGKTGNIFFEEEPIKFDILYENITDHTYVFDVEYIVRDYNGEVVKSYTAKRQANSSLKDGITFPGLPYGIYRFEIKLTGRSIEQAYTTEFSHSRRADQTNYHFGTNIHYDDVIYNETDVKALSDLIKNSGFGFVRSSLRWHQIEQTRGVYKIPDNVKLANQYLDEIGLEMLAIVYTENRLYTSPPFDELNTEQMAAFQNYCKYVAEDLKDYTDYFCMLNEINLGTGGYQNNEQNYVDISKAGYAGIKAGHPNAFINGGSLAGWSRDYANKTYQLGILDYCDSYSMHVYSHSGEPETYYMYQAMPDHKKNLKNYDTSGLKQAWITESGWPTRAADDTSKEDISRQIAKQHDSASELQQAQWYARSMAINGDKSRIDKFFYYSMNDDGIDRFDIQSNFGILHAKEYAVPFAAKPAYLAVCAYNDIVGDSAFVEDMITDGSGFANKYRKADGTEVICLWGAEYYGQNSGIYQYKTDAPYAAVYDMYGNVEYLETTNGSCAVAFSNEPVYVTPAYSKPEPPADEDPQPSIPSQEFDNDISIMQNGEQVKALWFMNPEDKIQVRFETDQPDGTPMTVICALYNKESLIGMETKDMMTDTDVVEAAFDSKDIVHADSLKLMIWDSLTGLKPLKNVVRVDCFDNDASVAATLENGVCTVGGLLKDRAGNENVMVSVFSNNTTQSVLTEEKVSSYVLYQNQIKSAKDGSYQFSFKLPESYHEASAMVIISTKNSSVQSIIPAVE